MVLPVLFFLTSLLYSAVGQAGGSGYLAIMALCSVQPEAMKPTALVLNVIVALVTTGRFYRAGHFSWELFWPFAVTSIPCSFLGGWLSLAPALYRPLVGAALIYAAWRTFKASELATSEARPAPRAGALVAGSAIGLLSGLTGVGGGIFLTPLLLARRWADPRQAAGISAVFILVNSVAGLLGHLSSMRSLPSTLPVWAGAAVLGGWLGAGYGSRRAGHKMFRIALALVLTIGGARLLLA